MQKEHLNDNKDYWNKAVDIHFASDFYAVADWQNGKTSLNAFELNALVEHIKGKRLLHLQCHFGQDTLSWARLGAECMGADFSEIAIATAQKLNTEQGLNAEFVCANLYDLMDFRPDLQHSFDVVFTSYGTIGWLPDLGKWAATIAFFLKQGGTFYIADFHPTMWMLDENFKNIHYSYFNAAIITEEITTTYADKTAEITGRMHSWNHPFTEIITNLLQNGLEITLFNEYNYSPYACFSNMEWDDALGGYIFPWFERKMPMIYEIKAIKK
jgi:2-polyprenyl-3-methyl-5-hydroxy-6-metoxy-1,4-benzoquinol methylase